MALLTQLEGLFRELLKIEVLEEQMNRILGMFQHDLSALSSGIFLYRDNKYQLKIGRNISHTYTKNTIFDDENSFIKELKQSRFLSLKDTDSCRFEHHCRHILVQLLQLRKEVYGFIFADKDNDFFTEEEETAFRMIADITSMILAINRLNVLLSDKQELDETTLIYRYKTFMIKGTYLYHLLHRTSILMSVAILKINKYFELVRVYGVQQVGQYMQETLSIVQENIKPIDILGKIFDDTYAIIFPNKQPQQIEKTLIKINHILADNQNVMNKKLSWGIAGMKKSTPGFEQLVSDAEEAAFDASRKEEQPIVIYED